MAAMVHCLHRNTSGWHRHRKFSRASNGSTAFPLDLLIFCPFSSCTCPRTITFSYGALLNKRVDSAIREWNHPRVWSTASEINCAGKLALKHFFIFKWIVILCKRHGSGIEPAVHNFRYTLHHFTTVRTGESDFINIRTVQFYRQCFRLCRNASAVLPGFRYIPDGRSTHTPRYLTEFPSNGYGR